MTGTGGILAYEIPEARPTLGHLLRARLLAGQKQAPRRLLVADLEALSFAPEQAESIPGVCASLECLYRRLIGEGLGIIRESALAELPGVYRRLSGQVTVVSLLRGQPPADKPLTHARLSGTLARSAMLYLLRPERLIVARSLRPQAESASALLAKLGRKLELEVLAEPAGTRLGRLSELPLAEPEALLEQLSVDPLRVPGKPCRPRLCPSTLPTVALNLLLINL